VPDEASDVVHCTSQLVSHVGNYLVTAVAGFRRLANNFLGHRGVFPNSVQLMSCDQFPLGSQAFAQHTVDRVWSRLPRRSIVRGRINDTRRKNVSKLKHLRAARFANLSARSCQRA